MLELWLIRHGETDWNRERRWQGQSDIALNDLGLAQARCLQPRMHPQDFDVVYASDLSRARVTAELAFPDRQLALEPRLRELHFGDFEGKTWAELEAAGETSLRDWVTNPYEVQPPGGEHYRDMAARVSAWFAELPDTGRVAAVAHGGVIRALMYGITGVPNAGGWAFSFDNGSLSILQKNNSRTIIKTVNDTAHLADNA